MIFPKVPKEEGAGDSSENTRHTSVAREAKSKRTPRVREMKAIEGREREMLVEDGQTEEKNFNIDCILDNVTHRRKGDFSLDLFFP